MEDGKLEIYKIDGIEVDEMEDEEDEAESEGMDFLGSIEKAMS